MFMMKFDYRVDIHKKWQTIGCEILNLIDKKEQKEREIERKGKKKKERKRIVIRVGFACG